MITDTWKLHVINMEWDLWSQVVFGSHWESLLSLTSIDDASGARTRTEVHDSGAVKIWIAEQDARDPFTFVHELAHGYHSLMFPEATKTCVQSQAEAAALMCEHRLIQACPYLRAAYQSRAALIHASIEAGNPTMKAALTIMEEIQSTNPGHDATPLYELVQAIMNGAYGDGYAEVPKTTH